MVVTMDEWYVIETDIENAKELYTVLRDRLNCEGLAGGNLYNLARGNTVFVENIKTIYVQLVNDGSSYWHYLGASCSRDSFSTQAVDLTMNEFYSRFLQHTVTL